MSVCGPVQTDQTLLRYASAITEQQKCRELLAEKFDRFQIWLNNTQQHPTTCNKLGVQTDVQTVTCNIREQCWELLANNDVASVCTGPYFQGSSKVYGIRDHRSARGWDQGSQP